MYFNVKLLTSIGGCLMKIKNKEKKKIVISRRKIIILFSLGFAQCVIFLMPYISSVFYIPLQDSLKCTNTQVGFLVTLMGIAEIASFFPGGWVADRFNPKKLIIISLILEGIIICICALDPNYILYCVMWVFMGVIGNFLYWSAGMKSVRLTTDVDEQGKGYGYFYCLNNLSGSLINAGGAAIIAGYGVYITLGFRYVVLLYGVLNFVAAIVIWFLLPNDINDVKNIENNKIVVEKVTFKDMGSIMRHKETWLFAIVAFCLYSMMSLSYYFTPYFTEVMHLSVASAAIIYVLTGPFGALLGPLFGIVSDMVGSTIKVIVGVMCLTVIVVSVLLVCTGKLPLAGAIAIDGTLTAVSTGIYSIMFSSIEELGLDRRMAGSCIGVASIIAYTPDVFMNSLFGSWLDKYKNAGYTMIFTYALVVSIIAVVLGTILYFSIRKSKLLRLKNTETVA